MYFLFESSRARESFLRNAHLTALLNNRSAEVILRAQKMAKILTDCADDIALAGKLLHDGELVAIPTETVYGLAADAFNEDAVRRIFSTKGRPFIDPLIVHVHSLAQAGTLADISRPEVKKLADAFWPGPLSLVLPKRENVPALVTAGEPTVAIRMPAHPLARKILLAAKTPLAAPSANPFGYVSPTSAAHVQDSLGARLGWIADGGECECGIESTIALVPKSGRIKILRLGVITRERIEEVLGEPVEIGVGLMEKKSESGESAQIAPGMLKKHYSPRVPVELWNDFSALKISDNSALVFQQRPKTQLDVPAGTQIFWLSEDGDQAQVARTIFALLRKLDATGTFSKILVEKSPAGGIGDAVNDRLGRAAAK